MTTLKINVGDEFIREGIRSMLDEILPAYDPFFVNKVDLKTLHEPVEEEPYRLADKFHDADVIIQAGSPVYWNLGRSKCYNVEWAEELWFKRIFILGPQKIVLNLGAGSCQALGDSARIVTDDPSCKDFIERVSRACALITVRDPLASEILNDLHIPHFQLPCPSFYAARRYSSPLSHRNLKIVGINLMPLSGHYRLSSDIDPERWEIIARELVCRLRSRHTLFFIAHNSTEQEYMERFREASEVLFGPANFRDYFPVYSVCNVVLANRVHGALCAAGFGRPAVIVGNDSRMFIGEYISLPLFPVQQVQVEELESTIEDLLKNALLEEERLLDLREASVKRYKDLISPLLKEWQKDGMPIFPYSPSIRSSGEPKTPVCRLASKAEIQSQRFFSFMNLLNTFASRWGLRQFTDWSKFWEYTWLWFNGLSKIEWLNTKVLDIGSELSPMPWFLASIGARVTMVETNGQWTPLWENIRDQTGCIIDWHIVPDEVLPFEYETFDVVTSFSVIEHQKDKERAINEVARVLKPGGLFAISFDICESEMGMTFPEWNGYALTTKEFESLIWNHPEFDNGGKRPQWNFEDCAEFIQWHLQSAPHHNYVVGAAVLKKKKI